MSKEKEKKMPRGLVLNLKRRVRREESRVVACRRVAQQMGGAAGMEALEEALERVRLYI
jgi:hypothetical protein